MWGYKYLQYVQVFNELVHGTSASAVPLQIIIMGTIHKIIWNYGAPGAQTSPDCTHYLPFIFSGRFTHQVVISTLHWVCTTSRNYGTILCSFLS